MEEDFYFRLMLELFCRKVNKYKTINYYEIIKDEIWELLLEVSLEFRVKWITMQNLFTIDNVELKNTELRGWGVFAKKDIKKDEIITFYPCDKIYMLDDTKTKFKTIMCEKKNEDFDNFPSEVLLKYGINITVKGNPDIDNIKYICANPKKKDNMAYIGHYINDYCRSNNDNDREVYERVSKSGSNCSTHEFPIGRPLFFPIIAEKDIKKGEEIFMSYGYGYWKNQRKNDD